ncbi:MAG: hypothetical protein KAT29_11855, partial [Anaerolineales bacterium]|nr:hypothetical protein [Anaerolineales bacterium]
DRLATGSVLSLAAATLTKGLPLLLVPLFTRRWGLKRLFAFGILIVVILAFFSMDAGWGLFGPLDGRGVFGAIRIYLSNWNFNGSLYHWLEVYVTGHPSPGAVPQQVADPRSILFAKLITNSILLLVISITSFWIWRNDRPGKQDAITRTRTLLRLALVPLIAYIMVTTTVHPWYLAVVIPFAPFLLSSGLGDGRASRFLWPLLYLSCMVALSYMTYFDPNEWREFNWVRSVEYVPFYALLLWAALPWLSELLRPRMRSLHSSGKDFTVRVFKSYGCGLHNLIRRVYYGKCPPTCSTTSLFALDCAVKNTDWGYVHHHLVQQFLEGILHPPRIGRFLHAGFSAI